MFDWLSKTLFATKKTSLVTKSASPDQTSAAESCKNRGNVHLAKGELNEAMACYQQAITIDPNYAEAFNNLGLIFLRQGKTNAALTRFQQALALKPDLAQAHVNCGNIFRSKGLLTEATASFLKALSIDPELPEVHNNLGCLYQELGQLDSALISFQRALTLKPDFAEAYYNLGVAHQASGNPAMAMVSFEDALSHKPDYPDAHNNLGDVYQCQGDVDRAMKHYSAALALDPTHVEARINLGNGYREKRKLADAESCYRTVLSCHPNNSGAYNNLGLVLYDQGKLDEAEACYRRAISIKPDFSNAHSNLGVVLHHQGKLSDAQACLQQALTLDPQYADAYNNLGLVLQARGHVDKAIDCYEKAILLEPENELPQLSLAVLLISMGRLGDGWKGYESRFRIKGGTPRRNFPSPEWSGEPLNGKTLLIWGEQGIGDEILFASMFPEMIAQTKRCVIECAPKLVPLFAHSFSNAEVVPRSNPPHPATLDDIDYQSAAGRLARWQRASLDHFPNHEGYLVADPVRIAYWRKRLDTLGPGIKIGFGWRGGNSVGIRRLHYTTIDQWGPIFSVSGVHFINLMYDECTAELAQAHQLFGVPLHVFAEVDLFDDLAETASLTHALDLVICAPTASSFLAAALGVPTWMLTYTTPWQTLGTDHLPWFPAMHCYLRHWDQPWSDIIDAIAQRLGQIKMSRQELIFDPQPK